MNKNSTKNINLLGKEISIEITHACPNLCKFCSSNSFLPNKEPEKLKNEMSTQKIIEIMTQAKLNNFSILSLSGGEPAIHKDIDVILKTAGDLDYYVYFYTSGTRYDDYGFCENLDEEFLEKMQRFTNKKLKIILDVQGCNKELVDNLMGIDYAFERITETMEICKKLHIKVETHFVPMNENIKYIYETADFCERMGVEQMSFLRAVPQGRIIKNNLMPSPKQFRDLLWILIDLFDDYNRGYRKMNFRAGHPIKNFFALLDHRYKFSPCRGGSDAPLVTPLGYVDMCPAWKGLSEYTSGNVFVESFDHIWQKSNFYIEFREFLKFGWKEIRGFCKDCPFLCLCKGGCTAQRIYYFGKTTTIREALRSSPDPLCPYYNDLI